MYSLKYKENRMSPKIIPISVAFLLTAGAWTRSVLTPRLIEIIARWPQAIIVASHQERNLPMADDFPSTFALAPIAAMPFHAAIG